MLLNCGVGEDSWESLGLQGDQPVNPKGNQSWILRTDAEAENPILWPHDGKNWLIGKDPAAGKDWRQEKKGMTKDEMVGGHHQLDGHEFEQTLGFGDGQGGLACCSPWDHKESDTTVWLNWTDHILYPWWLRQWRICLQCRRSGFDPWHRKIPWKREWLSTPAFLHEEFHGQGRLAG